MSPALAELAIAAEFGKWMVEADDCLFGR